MSSRFTGNFKNIKAVIIILTLLTGIMVAGNIKDKTQKYDIPGAEPKDEAIAAEDSEEGGTATAKLPDTASAQYNINEKICVDITGAVSHPSVVEVEGGDRLQKAVELAGGLTTSADRNAVNLAQKLIDGAQYVIPSKGEDLIINRPENTMSPEADQEPASSSDRLNINTASKDQLMELNGIGEVISQRILDYRNEHGPFKSVEGLSEVSGIGDKKFEDIKNDICVE